MPLIRKPSGSTPAAPTSPGPGDPAVLLATGSADERRRAARALSSAPGGVAVLTAALESEDDGRVREAIFTSLARASTAESVDTLLTYLRRDDAGLRTAALDALCAAPDAVLPRMAALLADPDPDVRLLSCEIARGLRAADAIPLLAAMLESEPQANVCGAAIEVLAEIGDASALPALQRCATRFEGDAFVGFAVRVALQRISPGPGGG